MKSFIYLLLLVCSIIPLGVWGYQQQGFTQYTETNQGISFQCNNQCFVLLGTKGDSDSVVIKGIQGQGQIIVGALSQNGQMMPISQQILGGEKDYHLSLVSQQQIPDQAQVGIVLVGNITGIGTIITLQQSSLGQKISQGWKVFWMNEGQTFYGINLRYGQKIGSWSIAQIGYAVVFIALIILLILGRLKRQYILYASLIVYLVIAVRNQIDYSRVTIDGLKSYTFAQPSSKTYGNLGDFYEFVNGVRKQIGLDQGNIKQCAMYYECSQPWPYCAHMETVFMKPCEKSETLTGSDYQLYYKVFPETPLGKKMFEFNGSLLYQTN